MRHSFDPEASNSFKEYHFNMIFIMSNVAYYFSRFRFFPLGFPDKVLKAIDNSCIDGTDICKQDNYKGEQSSYMFLKGQLQVSRAFKILKTHIQGGVL